MHLKICILFRINFLTLCYRVFLSIIILFLDITQKSTVMKKVFLLIISAIIASSSFAQQLGVVESKNYHDIYDLFNKKNITVHYYTDQFAIISGNYQGSLKYSTFEQKGFDPECQYYIHFINSFELKNTKSSISSNAKTLFRQQDFSIIKIPTESLHDITPTDNHSLIHFDNNPSYLIQQGQFQELPSVTYDENVATLINKIEEDSIEATISYLSSYNTRDCYLSDIIEALNWIDSKFNVYNLDVSTQDLIAYNIPSFNVIATQTGTVYPEEYVVIGAHADSRSINTFAPGADDNASGVAGVLEVARILSKYTFDRTIVYCAFSGEEYGLYGSKYFASDFKNNDKNIIGYVNLDMIGYRYPGDPLHTSLIYPAGAQELADYYTDICSTYLPNFGVEYGVLLGGSSDHASFNNLGYMGIFPFEDVEHYSPYIHTSGDLLGTSVNSLELARNFTSAALATIASLAEINVNVSIGQHELATGNVKIYPNPAHSELYISIDDQQTSEIEIYNMLGSLVIKKKIAQTEKIDISSLSPGTYILKVKSKDVEIKKIIVR